MNDREMLKFAARAAGIELRWHEDGTAYSTGYWGVWNPLEDNVDAFWLSVTLSIDILHRSVGGQRVEVVAPGGAVVVEWCEEAGSRSQATRRAITRAAAEIGKLMGDES